MNTDKFIEEWHIAAIDLKLEIIVNFSLELRSGDLLTADLLLLNFGNENGMLIVRDYEKIKLWIDEILECGYGYSVLTNSSEPYDKSVFISMLEDWGWTGSSADKPSWIKS